MTYVIVNKEGRGAVLKVYLDEMSEEAKARCGTDFNPSGDPQITLAKALCVGAVEMATRIAAGGRDKPLAGRAAATAATEFEKGQMLLVKAVVHASKGR